MAARSIDQLTMKVLVDLTALLCMQILSFSTRSILIKKCVGIGL